MGGLRWISTASINPVGRSGFGADGRGGFGRSGMFGAPSLGSSVEINAGDEASAVGGSRSSAVERGAGMRGPSKARFGRSGGLVFGRESWNGLRFNSGRDAGGAIAATSWGGSLLKMRSRGT